MKHSVIHHVFYVGAPYFVKAGVQKLRDCPHPFGGSSSCDFNGHNGSLVCGGVPVICVLNLTGTAAPDLPHGVP